MADNDRPALPREELAFLVALYDLTDGIPEFFVSGHAVMALVADKQLLTISEEAFSEYHRGVIARVKSRPLN